MSGQAAAREPPTSSSSSSTASRTRTAARVRRAKLVDQGLARVKTSESYWPKSRTKASGTPFVSRGTRFGDPDEKAR